MTWVDSDLVSESERVRAGDRIAELNRRAMQPGQEAIWLEIADLASKAGLSVECCQALRRSAAAGYDITGFLLGIGFSLAEQGLLDTALSWMIAAVAERPDDPQILRFAGTVARSHPDTETMAAKLFVWASRLSPEEPALGRAAAEALFINGQFDAAIEQLGVIPQENEYQAQEQTVSAADILLRLKDGHRMFVRLTPDSQLPNNYPEYSESYLLDHVIGYHENYWAFGPLFDINTQSSRGFSYSSDRRFFCKFELSAVPSPGALVRLLPGEFYRTMKIGTRPAARPVWRNGMALDLDRVADAVDAGARFSVLLVWSNGFWQRLPVPLVFCYRDEKRILIRSGVLCYPTLLDRPVPLLGACYEAFCSEVAGRAVFNEGARHLTDSLRVGQYVIGSDGLFEAQGVFAAEFRQKPEQITLFMEE
jgi:hypothetical protein